MRPSSKSSITSLAQRSLVGKRQSLQSPDSIARQQYKQAKDYEQKMLSRVQYLAKEEEKFIKKIERTREDAVRIQNIKSSKINHL